MGISNSRERDGDGSSLPGKIDAELGKKKSGGWRKKDDGEEWSVGVG